MGADAQLRRRSLDCGNGLLLLIRQHLDPLEPGHLLEFHELVSWTKKGKDRSFLVCKGPLAERRAARSRPVFEPRPHAIVPVQVPSTLPVPAPAPARCGCQWPPSCARGGRRHRR